MTNLPNGRGIYFANTIARGVGKNGAGEKNENWGSEEQNEEGKRKKKKKEKGESDVFLLIYGTHFCC